MLRHAASQQVLASSWGQAFCLLLPRGNQQRDQPVNVTLLAWITRSKQGQSGRLKVMSLMTEEEELVQDWWGNMRRLPV